MNERCKTKYPILLVHGMGFHDHEKLNYWGRIPGKLEDCGAEIFYGDQDSHGSVQSNGRFLYERLLEVLAGTGAEKVNIIAHSKGGLDSRWMITHLDRGLHVASLTTIATPHRGSRTADLLLRFPDWLVRAAACACDLWYRLLGDQKPASYEVFRGLTTGQMEVFNRETPDMDGVFYQSFAFVMKHLWSDLLLWFPCLVVRMAEGPNDGLVTPGSAAWGMFRGIYTGCGSRGISHCDEVDLRRRRLTKKQSKEPAEVSDMAEFYCCLVEELKERGF